MINILNPKESIDSIPLMFRKYRGRRGRKKIKDGK